MNGIADLEREIFGPVLSVMPFDTLDEAIAMANDTEFGLASYFYTRDIGRVWRVAEALEYGIVGINDACKSRALQEIAHAFGVNCILAAA